MSLKINKLCFTNDHAGVEMKQNLISHFKNKYEIIDLGTNSYESVDYPDYAKKAISYLEKNDDCLVIAICGTGIGMCLALNKYHNIRCANITNPELAFLAKQHNNCNAISLSARFVSLEQNIQIIDNFLNAYYDSRHQRRIDKLNLIESNNDIIINNQYKKIIIKIIYQDYSEYIDKIIKYVNDYFANITFIKQKFDSEIEKDQDWNIIIFFNIKSIVISHNFVNNFDKCHKLFIFLTAQTDLLEMEDVYRKEFDFYFSFEQIPFHLVGLFLINNITKHFLKKESNGNIIIGNYVINKAERKFWKNTELINLSRYEFDILWLLMSEKKYLSQDEIYKKVWNSNDYDVTRLVTQYIFRIKKKIGKEAISTLNNEGYKFVG